MSTINAGGLLVLDPSDKRVIVFDWATDALPTGVTIATSTFTIAAIKQIGTTALSYDQASIPSGSRTTQLRLIATTATLGDRYTVANQVVTSETPAQTIERQITVLIQNR